MNLNKKIDKFTGDGIPAYNRKINELIDAVNWLAGVRSINGKNVRESDQGPVFDLSQINSSQTQDPWAIDPNGNQAGWRQTQVPDKNFSTNDLLDNCYIWSGPDISHVVALWMTDPNGVQAQWVQHQVCISGQVVNKWFWGTP